MRHGNITADTRIHTRARAHARTHTYTLLLIPTTTFKHMRPDFLFLLVWLGGQRANGLAFYVMMLAFFAGLCVCVCVCVYMSVHVFVATCADVCICVCVFIPCMEYPVCKPLMFVHMHACVRMHVCMSIRENIY